MELPFKLEWKEQDKLILLKTLKMCGHLNMSVLSNMLPHIPSEAIESMIDKLKTSTEDMQLSDELCPIDTWLHCSLCENENSLLSVALKFIYLFEQQPSASEANCDFRAIYNFLYQLSLGETEPYLLAENGKVLYGLMNEVIKEVWPKNENKVLNYLGTIYTKRKIVPRKVYPGKRKPV